MKRVDYYNFLLYKKMSDKTIYYRINRERILNRAKEYHKEKEYKEWI